MTVRRERESLGRAFARFWCAQSVSEFGDRITELALPATAVYLLHGSTLQVALITALAQAPNLLALPLGAWADGRASKRALMVAADLIRAVLLLTLPIAALVGSVALAHLYVLALLTGAAGVLFNVGYPSFFARLVPRTGYVRANSRLSASRSASFVGGPALAGGLIQLLTAPVAVLADAASFVFSAVLVGTLPPDERAGARPAMTERAMTE